MADGKTICWSQKQLSKEYATFQLPCGKCIDCRLDYARQWAIRCVHEAQMHPRNSFITLTYSDENLKNPKLDYSDFQKFMKKLRKLQNEPLGVFVTGEYGELTKRPHWHAIIFNWSPSDAVPKYKNERGDQVWSSETLSKVWGLGHAEFGSVTMQSAGYCARYAAKKLVHGRDDEHEYQPISKKSSKHAIGKKWLESFWPDVFTHGKLVLADGTTTGIPRYYERWFRENHPSEWLRYVTVAKQHLIDSAVSRGRQEQAQWDEVNNLRLAQFRYGMLSINEKRRLLTQAKFKQLQGHLKL